jgi:polysaccharide pyruvyl transferase WcaK-like protein
MENTGEKEYCLNIKDFDPENTTAKFTQLWEHREAVQQSIEKNVNKFRSALDEQYEYLFRTI